MATAAVIENDVVGSDLAVITPQTAAMVLQDEKEFASLFAKVKAETEKLVADTSTKKGRDEIRSMAAKVVRTRTTIDKARLGLTADWRDRTNKVNAQNKLIEAQLDALADEVRRPLTEWEAAEKERNDRVDAMINQLARDAMVSLDETAADVWARGMAVYETTLDPALFGDKLDAAQKAKAHAVDMLKTALARLTREEAERVELERLRAEAAERAEADRIAAEKAEVERQEAARIEAERVAAEQAKEEQARQAALAEERRVAAEKAEAERIERAKVEAAERAQREAEQAARAEQERRDREHAAQLAEAQAERDRIAKIEADRQAEIDREFAEQAKRDADQAHRTAIKTAAKQALMTCGADEETARKIVVAILAGEVPNVSLRF